jgi:hypothetical protein
VHLICECTSTLLIKLSYVEELLQHEPKVKELSSRSSTKELCAVQIIRVCFI